MKIYTMTATFGKLEHETLRLQPGLNIVEAPNEWGKSTWCAFLVSMLYGLDTRAKSTKNQLADKDHYAPWSGSPMSGRIELNWNGRDITIERRTKGRTPMGEFRAYETDSGMDVPELNGLNCGQTLLGVERSVFARAGFLRLTDLPVTQDDALRRRLNNLVTTGDESSAGDTLQKSLKELKNKCRFNRTGLLPQAEAQRDQLQGQLDELEKLDRDFRNLQDKQQELEQRLAALLNHKAALRYAAAMEDAQKVQLSQIALDQARAVLAGAQEHCDGLPTAEEARKQLLHGQAMQDRLSSLNMEQQMLPPAPQMPQLPQRYFGGDPEGTARIDAEKAKALREGRKKQTPVFWILAALCLAAGISMLLVPLIYGWACIVPGIALLAAGILHTYRISGHNKTIDSQYSALEQKYPGIPLENWSEDAAVWADKLALYETQLASYNRERDDLSRRSKDLQSQILAYAPEQNLSQTISQWQQALAAWDVLEEAARDAAQAEKHLETVRSMSATAQPAPKPDELTYPEAQTDSLIASARFELQQLHGLLGQNQGRALNIGSQTALREQLKNVNCRIRRLEDVYASLELAQDALYKASTELQRRFAPRISKRAQELFRRMTGGKYTRLALSDDFTLSVGADFEDTLRQAMWRSDGTMDAVYLALRLAVAEELTPFAPLVLDDALVRLDRERLTAVMDILKEMAEHKQVILFTCQGREKETV